MAEALWRLRKGRAHLLTAVGDDADGRYLRDIAPGLILDGCAVPGARTSSYAAVLDSQGECKMGLGDMGIHDQISIDLVKKHSNVLEQAPLVVLDGNAPQSTIQFVVEQCNQMNKPVFYEPTDRRKAAKPLRKGLRINYTSPNLSELRAMAQFLKPNLGLKYTDDIEEILDLSKMVLDFADCLIVTIGAKGVIIIRNTSNAKNSHSIQAKLYPVDVIKHVENVSGAGDCFASGFLHGVLLGLSEPCCVTAGFISAKSALLSSKTVPPNLAINSVIKESPFEKLL